MYINIYLGLEKRENEQMAMQKRRQLVERVSKGVCTGWLITQLIYLEWRVLVVKKKEFWSFGGGIFFFRIKNKGIHLATTLYCWSIKQ